MEHLNTQARVCLKSLFNISKKSKNDIHRLYNIPNVCDVIDKRRLNLLNQILTNRSTKSYVCFLLSTQTDIEFSFLHKCQRIITNNNLTFVETLYSNKHQLTLPTDPLPSDTVETYSYYIKNWHIDENRVAFKALLEERVARARTEE